MAVIAYTPQTPRHAAFARGWHPLPKPPNGRDSAQTWRRVADHAVPEDRTAKHSHSEENLLQGY